MFFLVPKLNADGTWFNALESHRTQSVNIEFTSDCNLRCSYCAVSQSYYVGEEMSADTVDLVYRGLKGRHLEMVTLNGHGETTMIPDWPRKLKPFIDDFPVGMTSNFARPLSVDEQEAFARFKSINMSLDTADAALLKRIRRKVSLDQMLENLVNIRATADRLGLPWPAIYIFCTVYDENVLHLEELARLAVSLRVTGVIFGNLMKHPDVPGACNVRVITSLSQEAQRDARRVIDSSVAILREHGVVVSSWGDTLETMKDRTGNGDQADAAAITAAIQDKLAVQGHGGWNDSIIELCGREDTRACLDPWLFTQVDAHANVLPCCIHTPIGVLDGQRPLDAVLNNEAITRMRGNLLMGRLDAECNVCPTRRRIEKSELRRRYINQIIFSPPGGPVPERSWRKAAKRVVAAQLAPRGPMRIVSSALRHALGARLMNRLVLRLDDGVPADLKDRLRFDNVMAGCFGIGDRVYLHPNSPRDAPATVRFRGLDLQGCTAVDLYLYKDNERSHPIQFDLSIDDSSRGSPVHEESRVVKDAVSHWVVGTSTLTGRYDLTLRTRMAPGAESNRFAWAYVGYPIFHGPM